MGRGTPRLKAGIIIYPTQLANYTKMFHNGAKVVFQKQIIRLTVSLIVSVMGNDTPTLLTFPFKIEIEISNLFWGKLQTNLESCLFPFRWTTLYISLIYGVKVKTFEQPNKTLQRQQDS